VANALLIGTTLLNPCSSVTLQRWYFFFKQPSDLRLQFKTMMGLKPVFASTDAESSALLKGIMGVANITDCVGPSSLNYAKRVIWGSDSKGNSAPYYVPGNQTGCLMDKRCSYNPWSLTTLAQCYGDGSKTGVCQQCRSGFCNSITSGAYCVSYGINNALSCTAANGTYANGGCYYSASTPDTCLVGTSCNPSVSKTDYNNYCSSNFCIRVIHKSSVTAAAKTATTQSLIYPTSASAKAQITGVFVDMTCTAPWIWDPSRQLCIRYDYTEGQCSSQGNTYSYGRTWYDGVWNTPAKCTATCDIPEFVYNNGNQAQCESTFFCNNLCPKCKTTRFSTTYTCISTTIVTQVECTNDGGNWSNNGGQNVCYYPSLTSNTTCLSPRVFATCGSAKGKTACGTNSYSNQLSCKWNDW
jgi:hypothetical protein